MEGCSSSPSSGLLLSLALSAGLAEGVRTLSSAMDERVLVLPDSCLVPNHGGRHRIVLESDSQSSCTLFERVERVSLSSPDNLKKMFLALP